MTEILSGPFETIDDAKKKAKYELKIVRPEKGQTKEEAMKEESQSDGNFSLVYMGDISALSEEFDKLLASQASTSDSKAENESKSVKAVTPPPEATPAIPVSPPPPASDMKDVPPNEKAPASESISYGGKKISGDYYNRIFSGQLRKDFPSAIEYEFSLQSVKWSMPSLHINKFSTLTDFYEAKMELIERVISRYDFILAGTPRIGGEDNGWGRRIVDPDYCGVSWKKFIDAASNMSGDFLYNTLSTGKRNLRPVQGKFDQRLYCIGEYFVHPVEWRIQNELERLTLADRVDLRELEAWLHNFDSDFFVLRRFASVLKQPLNEYVMFKPGKLRAYDWFLYTVKGLKDHLYQATVQIVKDHMNLPLVPKLPTVDSLHNYFEARFGQYGDANDFPAELLSGDGQSLLVDLLTVGLNGEFMRLDAVVPTEFDPVFLANGFMIEQLTPDFYWREEFLREWRNYKIYHLALPFSRPRSGTLSPLLIEQNIRNHDLDFMDLLQNIIVPDPIRDLIGVDAHSTFANADYRDTYVSFPPDSNAFVNNRAIWHRYIAGVRTTPYSTGVLGASTLSRFTRYLAFCKYADDHPAKFVMRTTTTSAKIRMLLSLLRVRETTLRQCIHFQDGMLQYLGISSLMHPRVPRNRVSDDLIRDVRVQIRATYNMLMSFDYSAIMKRTLSFDAVEYGWSVNAYFEKLAYNLYYYNKHVYHLVTSATDRGMMAVRATPDFDGLSSLVQDKVITQSDLVELKNNTLLDLVTDSHVAKRDYVFRQIEQNKHLFGYQSEFAMSLLDIRMPIPELYHDLTLTGADQMPFDRLRVHDRRTMIRYHDEGTLGAQKTHLLTGGIILVTDPLWITEGIMSDDPTKHNSDTERYVGWDYTSNPPQCKGVKVFWAYADVYNQRLKDAYFALNYPKALVTTAPFYLDRGTSYYNQMYHQRLIASKYIQQYSFRDGIVFNLKV
jgi:hypothetical protein